MSTCRTIAAVPAKLTVSCWGIVTYSFAYSPRVHRAICKFSLHGISIHDDTTLLKKGHTLCLNTRKRMQVNIVLYIEYSTKFGTFGKFGKFNNLVNYNGIRPFRQGQPSGRPIVSDTGLSLSGGFAPREGYRHICLSDTICRLGLYPRAAPEGRVYNP